MKKLLFLTSALIVLSSHDMFLKMDSFFLEPDSPVSLHLYNGTFDKSENVITRDRMQDVMIVGNGSRQSVDTSMWTEDGDITVLNFQSGDPGTWVAGVSTLSRNIELPAKDFNDYLAHDGVLDMIEKRKNDGTMDQPAVEKYAKHVKAIFQVGDTKTNDWETPLGYPIEFVPLNNPYELKNNEKLNVRLLLHDRPLVDQLVHAGFAGSGHSHQQGEDKDEVDQEVHHHDEVQMRTDANGVINLKIDHDGQWYLRTIHMVLSKEEGLTHESNWATLTFEVSGSDHSHPIFSPWLYWAGGLLILIGLFFYLKK